MLDVRTREPTDFERRLGDAFELILRDGNAELPELVRRLNALPLAGPDGEPWSESQLVDVLSALRSDHTPVTLHPSN